MGIQIGQAASLVMQRHLQSHTNKINSLLEQLSTGYKVNSAGDNPAGIAQINEYQSQIRGMDKAYENLQQGLSLLNTAEDGLNTILAELQNYRETALEASADGISDYSAYQSSASAHQASIDLAAGTTTFNGNSLLDGSISGTFFIQSGPNSGASNRIDISNAIDETATVAGLSLTSFDLSDQTNAQNAVTAIDAAIESITGQLTEIGSFQNILSSHADLMDAQAVNLESALSSIRDVDTAFASAELTRFQSLQSAAATSLLTANSQSTLYNLLY